MSSSPRPRLAAITYLVTDYDEAIDWFTRALGFQLVCDTRLNAEKRWVEVEAEPGGTRLLLAKAATPEQARGVGAAAGGRVAFFLHTDDLTAKRKAMEAGGVVFEEHTRQEPYGKVAVFRDLYGNRWDLLEPAQP